MTVSAAGFLHVQDEQIQIIDLEYYAGTLSYHPAHGFIIWLGVHLTEEEKAAVATELIQRYLSALAIGWQDKNFRLYTLAPAPYDCKRKFSFGGSRNHSRNPSRVIG